MSANPYAGIYSRAAALGLDEEAMRDLYERETSKRSLKAMTYGERGKVIAAMDRAGARRNSAKQLDGTFAKKLQALWIAAFNLGLVADRRDGAMLAWIKRQTGIDHTRFLVNAEDARKAVEGLKQMLSRAGVDWSNSKGRHWLHDDDRWRIVSAQWAALVNADALPAPALAMFIEHETGKQVLSDLSDREWIAVMNALGVFVRKARATK